MSDTHGIDFASLTLKDALDLAIRIEEEAYERYGELAERMERNETLDAARFFRFMMANEDKHRAALAERRQELFSDMPSSITRAMIFEIEVPDSEAIRADMTLQTAMQAALRAEEKAHAFFAGALPEIENASVRTLFEDLCNEEIEHQNLVRRELEKAAT
jgi:rubrerythrin